MSDATESSSTVRDVGSRLELFVDDWLIEAMHGEARRQLYHPTPAEVALVCDAPWEGSGVNYLTCLKVGDQYRLYYRGTGVVYRMGVYEQLPECACVAQSDDGIHWTRPELGLHEVAGTRANNVVLTSADDALAVHNFTPFIDTCPDAPADERWKAVGGSGPDFGNPGLMGFLSPDGLRWRKVSAEPILVAGALDSQNVVFWDALRGEYRFYGRKGREGRDIFTCTSPDFRNWSTPEFLSYAPGRVSELYTNQVQPYYRAPHLLLGFPTRYIDRGATAASRALPQPEYRQVRSSASPREGTALTDGMFMSSRDRLHFQIWPESFLRPGPQCVGNWFYGDNYQAWGLVETPPVRQDAPDELSIYATESTGQRGPARIRRFTIRVDGFVSLAAPLAGGEVLTRPLRFTGSTLRLNYATSAAGSVRIELQNAFGQPIPGFTLADAEPLYGDALCQAAIWRDDPDLSALAGQPVRLRIALQDADLYAVRFCDPNGCGQTPE